MGIRERLLAEAVETAVSSIGKTGQAGALVGKIEPIAGTDFLTLARSVPNPYLAEFELTQADPIFRTALSIAMGRSSSTEMGWKAANLLQQDRRLALTNKYAWAVPTAEALATVARHGPVIEAGAGSGYWTSLLRKMNVDVVAFDQHGMNLAKNFYHERSAVPAWTHVIKGTETMMDKNPHRTLFMSFPPARDPFALNVLNRYRGNRFLFAGELGEGSVTGDSAFQEILASDWKAVQRVDLPNWGCNAGWLWDALHVFDRLPK